MQELSKQQPDPRFLLAAERTLLAWIRTGLALMGFGFVVARFGVFLRELAMAGGHPVAAQVHGPTIGVGVVASGVLVNLWASYRHLHVVRGLREGRVDVSIHGPIAVAVTTGVGGMVLIVLLSAITP